jgi:hypothetical protein
MYYQLVVLLPIGSLFADHNTMVVLGTSLNIHYKVTIINW